MAKGLRRGVIFLLILFASTVLHAQEAEPKKEFNELYDPVSVIKRASYDNFKNIKLLHAAIINFGGGEAEFDGLVNEYAEASALYFRESMIESANLFTKNERSINTVAAKIAQKYKEESEALHTELIKTHVRNNITLSLKGEKTNPTADLLITNAGFGIRKANDYLVRSKPVDSIYYFRRAKENCFKFYETIGQPVPDKFKKDMIDNQNRIYSSKEKEK